MYWEITVVAVPTEDVISKYEADTVEKLIKDEIKKLSLRLTAYKRPVNIVVRIEPLPRTTTRKVKRKEVKQFVNI